MRCFSRRGSAQERRCNQQNVEVKQKPKGLDDVFVDGDGGDHWIQTLSIYIVVFQFLVLLYFSFFASLCVFVSKQFFEMKLMGWVKVPNNNIDMVRTNHGRSAIRYDSILNIQCTWNTWASKNIVEWNQETQNRDTNKNLNLFCSLLSATAPQSYGWEKFEKWKKKPKPKTKLKTTEHIERWRRKTKTNNERNVYLWMHSILLIVEVQ